MRSLILGTFGLLLLASSVIAQQIPSQYQPQPKKDPIYNSQNLKASETNKQRQAEEAAKKNAPLIQKNFKGHINVHTSSVTGGGGVTLEKKY